MATTLNLRKRILLGYLMPLLLMLGVAVAVYLNVGTMHRISDELDQSYAFAIDVGKARANLAQIPRSARGYVLYKNESSRKNFQLGQAMLQEGLKRMADKVRDPSQLERLRQLNDLSLRMVGEEQKYLDLVDAGKAVQAATLFRAGRSMKLVAELDALVLAMEKREAEIMDERHGAESAALDRLMIVAAGATLFALVLALLLGARMAAGISRSIGEAIAAVSSSSTQIAAAVTETSSTVEELSVSSRQSASQAESTAAAAQHSLDMTQEGIRLANQVSTCIADMKQKVGSVAEQILRLSEQAGQIGGIAKVVGELAGETNMLALNAAVEAARAGEHGKGFAVVAAEVRKLADQSKKSAERANALVAEIQKATNSAVMVTEEGTATAAEVGRITDKTIEAFGSISTEANGVAVSAQQMRMNTAQQAAALAQVTEAMKGLSSSTTQLNGVAKNLKAMV